MSEHNNNPITSELDKDPKQSSDNIPVALDTKAHTEANMETPSSTHTVTSSPDLGEKSANPVDAEATPPPTYPKDWRFWMIFLSLCFSSLLSALDLTAISTALPNIVNELHGDSYVWVGAAYSLTSTAFLPLTNSLAAVFGRRPIMIASLVVFMLGSGISGGAKDMNMLIAARSIQGIGGGGILAMTEIVVCDLLPLQERGMYQGIIGMVWSLASAIGPLVGGALATNWKWLFFLNLPIGGVAIVLVTLFLNLKTPKDKLSDRLKKMDLIGNGLIIGATTALILGIVFGGSEYAWSSYQVLIPLILGIVGMAGFFFYEFRFAKHPTIPLDIVSNRTSLMGFFAVFMHGIIMMVIVYYFPVYLQATQGVSAVQSAIRMFGLIFTIAPFAIIAGVIVGVTGKYRILNYVAWVLTIIGTGLFVMLKIDTPKAVWVSIQVVLGLGLGLLYTGPMFAILAPTSPENGPPAVAFLTFARSMGQVWGVSIGATILQNGLADKLPADFLAQFGGHSNVAYAAIPILDTLSEPLKTQVRIAFNDSLRTIWIVCIPLAVTGLISCFFLKEYKLHDVTDENWGIEEKKKERLGEIEKAAVGAI